MKPLSALLAGILFGLGLKVSGMTEPANVIAFLDLGTDWSPALMLVMGTALLVTAVGYRLATRRAAPLFDTAFHAPTATVIDTRLILGSSLFGVGWGIAGFCPGPAIVGAFALDSRALLFVVAYLAGTTLFEVWDKRVKARLALADG